MNRRRTFLPNEHPPQSFSANVHRTHQRPLPGGRYLLKWSLDEDEVVILDTVDMYQPPPPHPPPPSSSFSTRTHRPLQFRGRGAHYHHHHHHQQSGIVDEVVILENLNMNQSFRLGGLTKEVISKNLRVKQINFCCEDEEDEICVICQIGFERKEKVGVLECKHCYHVDCIKEWLFYKNVCPLCKVQAFSV